MDSINYKVYYCIDNYKMEKYLTVGKKYLVVENSNPKYITVLNDIGQTRRYDVTDRFLSYSQYRSKIIEDILA